MDKEKPTAKQRKRIRQRWKSNILGRNSVTHKKKTATWYPDRKQEDSARRE